MRRLGQGGFATLEVILMVTVIGILAAIAVPRFEDITARANTARIQSDLTTLDTAMALYYMDNGSYPANLKADIADYVQDSEKLDPPTGGKVYVLDETDPISLSSSKYEPKDGRAVLTAEGKSYTAGQIGYKSSTDSGT